jgi:hypothetical protein
MEATMTDNVMLDHTEIEKLIERGKAARAENMRRFEAAASEVVASTLRAHHVIAVVAVLLISFGAKVFFFSSAPTAEASIGAPNALPGATLNVLQMHRDVDTKSLPVLKMNDRTFIFTE